MTTTTSVPLRTAAPRGDFCVYSEREREREREHSHYSGYSRLRYTIRGKKERKKEEVRSECLSLVLLRQRQGYDRETERRTLHLRVVAI